MLEKTPEREARFWAKVKKSTPDSCWEWTAFTSSFGYGQMGTTLGGINEVYYAHRICHEWYIGPTDGLVVRHKCDNPKCVNPNHLETGTHADNIMDMVSRGRHIGFRKITKDDAIDIRRKRADGVSADLLSDQYGISHQHVRAICRGDYWGSEGVVTSRRLLTKEELVSIKAELEKGVSRKEVQQKYGFSKALIGQIAIGLKDHLLKGGE